jgi:hypothetical protein
VTALAQAFEELLAALDRTETKFVVVGSVASGAHGLARLTNDIDIVVDLAPERVAEFCEVLGSAFYADASPRGRPDRQCGSDSKRRSSHGGMVSRATPRAVPSSSFTLRALTSSSSFRWAMTPSADPNSPAVSSRPAFPEQAPKTPFWPNLFGIESEVRSRTASGAIFWE